MNWLKRIFCKHKRTEEYIVGGTYICLDCGEIILK